MTTKRIAPTASHPHWCGYCSTHLAEPCLRHTVAGPGSRDAVRTMRALAKTTIEDRAREAIEVWEGDFDDARPMAVMMADFARAEIERAAAAGGGRR